MRFAYDGNSETSTFYKQTAQDKKYIIKEYSYSFMKSDID